jgi:hypothetical protein
MRTLTIALVHDGDSEQDSHDLFNDTLSPLLDHVPCDVHIIDESETGPAWAAERSGDDTPFDDELIKTAFVRTLRGRGADLAADRLELLDADQAWDSYFGPVTDQIEETLQ